ncbi:MAG: hypothetical protein WHS46_00180 [Desulfosoma sp.]
MKKIASTVLVAMLVLGAGLALAGDARIPQELQAEYEQATGTKATFAIWFPVAPELRTPGWENILILSNFSTSAMQVQCWFTSLARTQTIKLYELGKYEKRVFFLQNELGRNDEIYDIFCLASNLFGAGLLLLEGGNIVTAWPPVFLIY